MISSYDELTPESLVEYRFEDVTRACLILQNMAGHDVPDRVFDVFLIAVLTAIKTSADPDRAVSNLERWSHRVGNRLSTYQLLASTPFAAEILITVMAASQFFADLLIFSPEYLDLISDTAMRNRPRGAAAMLADASRRVSIAKTPNAKRDALRRFKAPEVLRIGVRDLVGSATLGQTVAEISDFADVCCRMALEIASEELGSSTPRFAIMAMGKLGGRELNYASDIDLIYVHGNGDLDFDPIKLAERITDCLARVTDAGFIFRVDLRLRPEGRFGPVSRSLASCAAYYESWAEPWEQQALMKCRFVAGDSEIGEEFMRLVQDFIYRPKVTESFLTSIRSNKRQLEDKIERSGSADRNVKEGVGAIRDIEFAIQLLQLSAGGTRPEVRTGNSLAAIEALQKIGLLNDDEAGDLSESYTFLRTVEHRLQLLDERAVRTFPNTEPELTKFSRRLGYSDSRAFLDDYRSHTSRVNIIFKRLFYGENAVVENEQTALHAWLHDSSDDVVQRAATDELRARGFNDVVSIMNVLKRNVTTSEYGAVPPETRDSFYGFLPALLRCAEQTLNPDSVVRNLDLLVQSAPSPAALMRSLVETTDFLRSLARIASDYPQLWTRIVEHPEFLDMLAEGPGPNDSLQNPTLHSAESAARWMRREYFRSATADAMELLDLPSVHAALTNCAHAILDWALEEAKSEIGYHGEIAIIGLGKLGGAELSFSSDYDVMYVTDGDDIAGANSVVKRIHGLFSADLPQCGAPRIELDARLRPDGKKGPLILTFDGYANYYASRAETWERQAMTKADVVAGDRLLGDRLLLIIRNFVYGTPLTDEQAVQIIHMKQRIEHERLKELSDIKLGPGGLTDIEWAVQFLQLKYGHKNRRLRGTNTLQTLKSLRDDIVITQQVWDTLDTTYRTLTELRNRMQSATSSEVQSLRTQCRDVFLRIFQI